MTSTVAANATMGLLSPTDSQSMVASLTNTTPVIEAALTAVEGKKSDFAAAGLTPVVHQDLVSLESGIDGYCAVL